MRNPSPDPADGLEGGYGYASCSYSGAGSGDGYSWKQTKDEVTIRLETDCAEVRSMLSDDKAKWQVGIRYRAWVAREPGSGTRVVFEQNLALAGHTPPNAHLIIDDSGAIVKASSTDATPPGITDRIITVSGELHQVMRAVCLIMQKCSEERSYHTFGNQVYTYHGQQAQVPALGMGGLGMGMGMGIGGMPMGMPMGGMGSTAAQLQTTMTVGVPDEHIGAVVGKGGKAITEIQVQTGVRIKISDRGDFLSGTRSRKVTIAGTTEGCQVAHYMICQKVNQNVQDIAARRGPKPAGSGRGPAFAQTYNSAGSVGGES